MDNQAKMTTNGRANRNGPSVTASFSELTHDVIELAELQAQLLALDVKETSLSTRTSVLLLIAGMGILLGSIPIALIAFAEVLIEQASWSHALSYAVSTLLGLALSAGLMLTAYSRFKNGVGALRRSREELSRNVAWIKSNLRSRATGAATHD